MHEVLGNILVVGEDLVVYDIQPVNIRDHSIVWIGKNTGHRNKSNKS